VGVFCAYTAVNPKRWREAVNVILDVFKKSKKKRKLLEKAKSIFIGDTILSNEKPSEIIENAAIDVAIYGRPRSVSSIKRQIEDIEIAEIIEVVDRYLKPENLIKVFIAPKGVDIRI
jgi:predicted Zn-dependent peptidase